ncbi:MAG: lactonase family protein [Methylacidiphilales bacterium]|nr:lactonase family protein [Candidatus Methylacidiphilales bacterium]
MALIVLLTCGLVQSAWGQDQVFAVEFDQGNNRFGTIDLYTGKFTQLGSIGSALVNDIAYSPDNILYGIEGSSLVIFNQQNGAITTVGNFGVSGIESLAFDPVSGQLYAASQGSLYRVDRVTGVATLIGSFGVAPGLNDNGQNIRFAADGYLYDTNTSTNGTSTGLYRIDVTTGAATYLGEIQNYDNLVLANAGNAMYGVTVNVTNSPSIQQTLLTFDLSSLDDGLYPHDITIIPLNGKANIPSNFNFSGDQDAAVLVPEPSIHGLIAVGLGLAFILGGLGRKRRST